ncbi:hypothetical protein CVD25_08580 [Bacillus canaveralius]|uniref:DUF1641 domain-containing protein n=1 Tax=Bacillus canaveralius TaxID=1403243 RepID=A0A2N5GL28_9BACI|nr:hypothetical protein [Bacillus canaveralius]PLR82221.1 hypothetical protein CU635_13760 [Bacillus canaveralius]PLR97873.1 hypothetical protein CVD25_08580 [Bacillus canaveralius]
MVLETPQSQIIEQDQLKSFTDAVLKGITGEMVSSMAEKGVKMVEMADDILQPETISLLKVLPEVSASLERTLMEVKRLEESGVLKSLMQLADLAASMKKGMTGPMVTDMVEKAVGGIEIADSLIQLGALDLVEGMLKAFDEAKKDRTGKAPLTSIQLMKALTTKETREGMGLMVSLLKFLPNEILK